MGRILDACCGGRMFWFDKQNEHTTYMDNRELDEILCDGRRFTVEPDVVADFRDMPFRDQLFDLVVFDPPHLIRLGDRSYMNIKYSKLDKDTWQDDLKKGFNECWRVLKDNGTMVFKWNEDQIRIADVLKLFPQKPICGNRDGKNGHTHWLVFFKNGGDCVANQQ